MAKSRISASLLLSITRVLADLTVLQVINCMNKKFHKTHISTSFVHKCHKSRPCLICRFYGLIQLYVKLSQNSYLHELCAQISQIHFFADLTVLRLITTVK